MRGIGHVGAVYELERAGYKFRNVAGTSAGAIVASLLAAGYDARELGEIMSNVNFEKFRQANNWYVHLGRIGRFISATRNFGVYSADMFEKWLSNMLIRKGVRTFADVRGRLKMTASDITGQRILVLPDDLVKFGIDPQNFSIATAVRMSMSIPIFYEPYELRDQHGNVHLIADGGMLSNYPIWLFDNGHIVPDVPLFGFRFIRAPRKHRHERPNFLGYLTKIIQTVIDDDDIFLNLIRGDVHRTINIPVTVGDTVIASTDFDMTREQIDGIYNNGRDAASRFLENWDFQAWKSMHRA